MTKSKTTTAYRLSKAQLAVLTVLKAGARLTRKEIAAQGKTDLAYLSTWIGSSDAETRKANDQKRGVKSLLTLKFVKDEQHDGEAMSYTITPAGRAALKAAEQPEPEAKAEESK